MLIENNGKRWGGQARGRWSHYQALYLTNYESRNCADCEEAVILGNLMKANRYKLVAA